MPLNFLLLHTISSSDKNMAPFLLLISFLMVAVSASHEAAQVYWNKALPNTPMPGAIKDFLDPVDIHGHGIRIGYKAVLEKDMVPGTKVTLHFGRTTAEFGPTFLSRQAATSIPFSSAELPAILNHFSLDPNSLRAQSIRKTLQECEMPAVEGETKYCATSLESMVEYVTSTLATRNVLALSTVMSKEYAPEQQYTIAPSGVKKLSGIDFVACHARKYPYAVLYCHKVQGSTAYRATLFGEDGTTVEGVASCHASIAGPDSKNYLDGVMIKPGTVPICHFLPLDHIVWSPSN